MAFLSFWRVLAKHVCWQSVTAPVWIELALCEGFLFNPEEMSESQFMQVKFGLVALVQRPLC